MKDWSAEYRSVNEAAEAALADFEREHRRIAEVNTTIAEASTTTRAKDRSLSIDFDGRGEITAITFHGTKYRSMAPTELAHVLLETIRAGRAECVRKMSEAMGDDFLPGISFADLASGKLDSEDVFQKLVEPFIGDGVGEGILGRSPKNSQGGGRNG
ncbi:MAG: hypothetical protein QOF58_1784 [Pseudonocardiales bacterium]|jgi:hypothetical protein|nr:hypothetical protein [Pseudonocardiales bacterium]